MENVVDFAYMTSRTKHQGECKKKDERKERTQIEIDYDIGIAYINGREITGEE